MRQKETEQEWLKRVGETEREWLARVGRGAHDARYLHEPLEQRIARLEALVCYLAFLRLDELDAGEKPATPSRPGSSEGPEA